MHPAPQARPVIGRFAPSPTGVLHLGSLTTALASFCHIKSLGGQWLLRLEDTDFERCKPHYSQQILRDLEALGLHWDSQETYQSQRIALYEDAIDSLKPLVYTCHCSRKQLSTITSSTIYPRLCLPSPTPHDAHPPLVQQANDKLRLMLPDVTMAFYDELQGVIWQNPQALLGDVVIKRQNGMINYILACALDDGIQNITHVMRGLDILEMTSTQSVIQQLLHLPLVDSYAHLPLLFNANGQKLSKQNLAKPIDTKRPDKVLIDALRLLHQPIPNELYGHTPSTILKYAIAHWQTTSLIGQQSLGIAH